MVKRIKPPMRKRQLDERDVAAPGPIPSPRQRHPFFERVGVTVGYQAITGERASWDGLKERLRCYQLEPLVVILGRIAAVLERPDLEEQERQSMIAKSFLAPQMYLRCKAAVAAHLMLGERPEVFGLLQVLNLMKVAFAELPVEESRGEPADLAPMGEALLMMTDLMNEQPTVPLGPEEHRAALYRDVFANGLFHVSDHDAHVLARSHDLYLVDRPHLRQRPDYIDLPALVRRSVGLDADTLWSVFFALSASTMPQPKEGKPFPRPIARSTFFTSAFSFAKEEVDRFLAPIAVDAAVLKHELELLTVGGLDRYNVLPFLNRPLIQFGDHLVPVCPRFVTEKLGRGLHFLGLNPLFPRPERDKYLRYIGEVFEDEVHQLFERVFGDRYRRLDKLKDGHEDRIADGLIILGDHVVVVETKAKIFTVGVRHAASQAEMDRKLDETVLRGAHQIHATIEAFRRGDLIPELRNTKRWFPLIVTLERMPMPPMIYDELARRIAEADLLRAADVAPYQLLEIDDLEFLEQSLLTGGMDLARVLSEKAGEATARWESFGHYLHRKSEPTFIGGKNKRLHERFNAIATQATNLYLNRAKSPEQ